MIQKRSILLVSVLFLIQQSAAVAFELKSKDVAANSTISQEFVFQGMGCNGANKSPELHWSGAPKETKSFAVTVYDPTAPTGSGFWHWVVINIPAKTTSMEKAWSSAGTGALEIASDFGTPNYGGPCPPPGKPHTYIFTVHALNTEKIDLPSGATNAFARFMIEGATIKKAKFTANYGR